MKTKLITLFAVILCCMTATAQSAPVKEQTGKKILVAYFSWGGNTRSGTYCLADRRHAIPH